MTWRTATPADEAALRRMMHALYVEDPSPMVMSDAKIERTLAALAREPVRGAVVVFDPAQAGAHNGTPAGYALLCSFWSNELGGEVCILDELYVAAPARRGGAATSLVQALVAGTAPWFRDAVAVELEVTPGNGRARALYERLGFAPLKNAVMRVARPPRGARDVHSR